MSDYVWILIQKNKKSDGWQQVEGIVHGAFSNTDAVKQYTEEKLAEELFEGDYSFKKRTENVLVTDTKDEGVMLFATHYLVRGDSSDWVVF